MADGGVREIVLANLQTELEVLYTADAAYNTVVMKVTRDIKPLNQFVRASEFPLIQIKAGTQDINTDERERTFDEVAHLLTVDIECALQARENVSTALNRLIEDVVKVVLADITRGGCATDTDFLGVTEIDELMLKNDAAVSFNLTFEILYSTSEGAI